jgi:glyoxylase-like metal-dependent hydrolase (beta-lactamase superfamily II)
MKIEQIYTGCLAHGAYYIESNGEAAIIDPLREVEPYIRKAEADGAKIKYVLETHFHADFVSGHIDLAQKTGAKIVYGPNAAPAFEIHSAKDGELLQRGNVQIKVLHTPGHTMESTCYLLIDENGKVHKGPEVIQYLAHFFPTISKLAWMLETDVGKKALDFFYQKVNDIRNSQINSCEKCKDD